LGRLIGGKSADQLPVQTVCGRVSGAVEQMSEEFGENIGPRLPKALLVYLARNTRLYKYLAKGRIG
jgi:hypothetical protein